MPTLDDQVLNRSGRHLDGAYDQRRARSSSPIKKRITRVDLPPIPYATEEDIKSVSSGGSRVSDELKLLSKSPLSKRLHINAAGSGSKYVIPIPFTLQLPPKLSPRNRTPASSCASSPERQKSPSRLMYTGSGYEMVDSDDGNSFSEAQLNKAIAMSPKTPTKSPSGPKGIYTKPKKDLDEMSVINEVPSAGNSRASSLHSRLRELAQETPPAVPAKPVKSMKTSKSGPIHPVPYPMDLEAEKLRFGSVNLQRKPPPAAQNDHQLQKTTTIANFSQVRDSDNSPYREQIRLFSEGSAVSSSRSFSSVEEAVRGRSVSDFRRGFGNFPNKDESVVAESDSESTSASYSESENSSITASSASWDSLQNSVDITIGDGKSMVAEESAEDSQIESEGEDSWTDSSVENASETNKNTVVNSLYLSNVDLPISVERKATSESEKSKKPDDDVTSQPILSHGNNGAGREFSFPNNTTNITNSPSIKSRKDPYENKSTKFNFSTSAGQIEIPDIDNLSSNYNWSESSQYLAVYQGTKEDARETKDESSSKSEAGSSVLEPIGFPSQAAKQVVQLQFQNMYHGSDADSDSGMESITYSAYSTTPKSKSTPCLSSGTQKSLPPLPQEVTETQPQLQPPVNMRAMGHRRGHTRSKSVDLDSLFSMNMRESVRTNEPSKFESVKDTEETENIIVNEPPKKISYEVDFTEVEKGDDEMQTPHGLDRTFTEHLRKTLGKMEKLDLKGKATNDIYIPPRSSEKTVPSFERQMFRLPPKPRFDDNSSNSATSYQSSRSAISNDSTAASDTESVVIDLTEDKFDICTVKRNNSTASYMSITEKTKEGKPVEVVLVDDDQKDELESIYSKYRNDNWLFRTNSTTSSSASFSSGASFDSNARSETALKLKPRDQLAAIGRPSISQRYQKSLAVPGRELSKSSSRYSNRRYSKLQTIRQAEGQNQLPIVQEK
ncbi:hypothetical protein PGUG_05265 [Meyerozyma guilliermondii ATCC 6260]|uniref:Uncharacterized protein n=1 Tax=Meyerozyma guilliermondii (strain ATCC 6260 / CBS 566 / DSM 6381 / JCM 1539 / NBRC 10279 / NRRL Y-324) TaxID=294746 RepID=A5DPR4_PICGU|nr:uncharacterized protein PGUG_05265 [Meyerozyma guilliermondii ATCC 6260]EDK41167.2 hypothetical protein PGUG_05265 [Meyerozyma guilliermondii ATCC 6260]